MQKYDRRARGVGTRWADSGLHPRQCDRPACGTSYAGVALSLGSNAKEYAMKTLTTGIVTAATLLSAAPAFAIDVDIGPGGIRVGPRYHQERYYRDRSDCRKVTIERPDGSVVTKYRCD